MRKVLIGLVAFIVLAIGAVLIVPGFIDWNDYKQNFTNYAESLTGRQLTIDGDIEMTILPAPAITVTGVSFANAPGADDPHMVRLSSLEVRVALGPLLGGEIQIQKVKVIDPVVLAEILPDGQPNWASVFAEMSSVTPSTTVDLAPSEGSATPGDGLNIQLDNVELVNATIMFRDATSGINERIEQLNASFKAASLQGPFESIGNLVAKGIPVSYEIAVDGIFQGRTVPVSAVIRSDVAGAEIQIAGNVFNLSEDPKFSGVVKSKGKSLAALLHAIVGVDDLLAVINQGFSLTSDMNATAKVIDLAALEIKLGDTALIGGIQADIADIISANVDLTIKHLNVDNLLALAPFAPGSATQTDDIQLSNDQSDTDSDPEVVAGEPSVIPPNIAGAVTLVIDAITYRREKAGPVRLNTELSNGELTISQFSAQLPGATELALFGFVGAQDGEMVFDGESEIAIGDTRRLARWLNVDISQIPNGRLRHVQASANVRASQKDVQLTDIKASFDRSNLAGGITLALRKRLAFGASFVLDRIDLDGYLAESTNTANAETSANSEAQSTETTAATTGTSDPLNVLSILNTFDANVHVKVSETIHQGISIKDVDLNSTLLGGNLTINNASVKNIAGARAKAVGTITDLGGNPKFENMNLTFAAKSVAKLIDVLALDLPVSAKDIGSVAADVTINGSALLPVVRGTLSGLGAKVSLDGKLSALPIKPLVDVDIALSHGNTAKLLRVLGVGYEPGGKIGGLEFTAHIRGGSQAIDISKLTLKQGDVTATGTASITLDTPRPVIKANIQTGDVVVDPFLPAEPKNKTTDNTTQTTSTGSISGADSTASGAPWPKDRLDLDALRQLDAVIHLQSSSLEYDFIALKNAVVSVNLLDGVLTAENLSGILFGGDLGLTGVLNARDIPSFTTTMNFKNGSIGSMLSSMTGEQSAAGNMVFGGKFAANGHSVADMVSALDGTGSFNITGLDVKGDGSGTPLAGIMDLVRGIGKLGAGLAGMDVDGLADAAGTFSITKGVAQIGDFALTSGFGDGSATGFVDLSGWNMDVAGNLQLKQNILTALLAKTTGALDVLPFSVTGAPDNPTVNLETASLAPGGGGLPIPGLDKLEETLPGFGSILQGVLGGGSSQTTTPSSPPASSEGTPEPQPQQQPESQEITPQDIINQLLQF